MIELPENWIGFEEPENFSFSEDQEKRMLMREVMEYLEEHGDELDSTD